MTLLEHRLSIKKNKLAYEYELSNNIERLSMTLLRHLNNGEYRGLTIKRVGPVVKTLIGYIFDAQDRVPMFHVEGTELPLCWNSPKNWDADYIKYEWGHLLSKNQNVDDVKNNNIENIALYSARCNQHIQSSMNIHELMVYGGVLANRISLVLTKRKMLFLSDEWKSSIGELNSFEF